MISEVSLIVIKEIQLGTGPEGGILLDQTWVPVDIVDYALTRRGIKISFLNPALPEDFEVKIALTRYVEFEEPVKGRFLVGPLDVTVRPGMTVTEVEWHK